MTVFHNFFKIDSIVLSTIDSLLWPNVFHLFSSVITNMMFLQACRSFWWLDYFVWSHQPTFLSAGKQRLCLSVSWPSLSVFSRLMWSGLFWVITNFSKTTTPGVEKCEGLSASYITFMSTAPLTWLLPVPDVNDSSERLMIVMRAL